MPPLRIFLLILSVVFIGNLRLGAQTECGCEQTGAYLAQHAKLIEARAFASADSLANTLKDDDCKYLAEFAHADVQFKQSEYRKSEKILLDSWIWISDDGCHDSLKAMFYFLLAKDFHQTNRKDSAVDFQLRCSEICEFHDYNELLYKSYANLGIMLSDMGQPSKAVSYQIKALNVLGELNDSSGTARISALIAGTYGTIFEEAHDSTYLDSVIYYLNIALPLAKSSGNRKALIHAYDLFAEYYYSTSQNELALAYCDSAMMTLNRKSDKVTLIRVYGTQSESWFALGNAEKSLLYADSAVALSDGWGQVDLIIASLQIQMKALMKLDRYKEAFAAQSRMTSLNDSLQSLERTDIINTLEQKYNKARNEEEIERLNHEAEVKSLRIEILVLGIAVLVVLLIAGFIWFRQRNLKAQHNLLESELRLNRSRMNPHFFFNALSSLQTFALQPDQADRVPIYLARYAKIMRQTLESTYNELVELNKEIDFITGYMEIQKIMHPGKFDFTIDASGIKDTDAYRMPSMIVQPFIENAVEHGFSDISYTGHITIAFRATAEQLLIDIEDNGSAVKKESKHEGYPSRATQIITDRLFLLKKATGKDSTFSVEERNNSNGYCVKIALPLLRT